MTFIILITLLLSVFAWDAVRKASQRREAGRAARAAYYQSELDRLRNKRDAEDSYARMMRSTQRLAEEAEAKRLEAAERRERYY